MPINITEAFTDQLALNIFYTAEQKNLWEPNGLTTKSAPFKGEDEVRMLIDPGSECALLGTGMARGRITVVLVVREDGNGEVTVTSAPDQLDAFLRELEAQTRPMVRGESASA